MQRSKTALVLAGGGLAGAAYEIGALCAIDEILVEQSVNSFDMYVGTSAGALVCAAIANGLTPRLLLAALERSLLGIEKLEPDHLFAFDPLALLRRSQHLPAGLFATARTLLREQRLPALNDLLTALAGSLPSGFYSTEALERYLRHALSQSGRTNRFRDLKHDLAIIATDLDTGDRAVFGQQPLDDVPISLAVAASAAIPLFYRPVRIGVRDYIDGGLRGTASIDLAIERGARLILCINPLVPLDNRRHPAGAALADQGALKIGNQVFRTFVHAGLHYHIKQVRRRHPEVEIILIEPTADDIQMFNDTTMDYPGRLNLAQHGLTSVATHLKAHAEHYRALLARHGIAINLNRLDQLPERIWAMNPPEGALHDQQTPSAAQAPADLNATLAELERILQRMQQARPNGTAT